VRAGLEVIEAVTRLSSAEPLSVRVGINTGIVVVGESEVAARSSSDRPGATAVRVSRPI